VICPVCNGSAKVAFCVLNSKFKEMFIVMYAMCARCYAQGDERSIIGRIPLEMEEFIMARVLGLIDLGELMDD